MSNYTKTLAGVTTILWLGVSVGLLCLASWAQPVYTEKALEKTQTLNKVQGKKQRLSFSLDTSSLKQGDVVQLIARHVPESLSSLSVVFDRKHFPFFKQGPGLWMALVPVDPLTTPGAYPITVNNNHHILYKNTLQVLDAAYKSQYIHVSPGKASLEPEPGELLAIGEFKKTQHPIRYWKDKFILPVTDCQNSPFGVKRYYNGSFSGNYHKGVDQRSPQGRPIKATADGIVKLAKSFRLHGGTVGLDHGQGVHSIYIHMSRIDVKTGQFVKQNQVIGRVGSTGFASGPHLHWGLYVHSIPVNPNNWLKIPQC